PHRGGCQRVPRWRKEPTGDGVVQHSDGGVQLGFNRSSHTGSTSLLNRTEVLVEGLGGSPPGERLAWTRVQRERDGGEVFAAVPVQGGALRAVLAPKAV